MVHLAHGSSNLTAENNILVLELKESFNKEGVQLVHSKISSFIEENSPTNWGLIIFLDKDTLLTMDAIEDTSEFFVWCQKLQCKKVAYVSISPVQTSVTDLIFKNINLERGFFEDINDAKSWILSNEISQ
ncbi:hypothetical protein [Pseudoalteromonas sp. MMG024]|uniref:hypothetical protein n=1 Tax=Pseudoalteromonas sp. MMG024 TaxID=2909980 RepID=UPI001F3B190E|nr:hypothetical protein [Pseudoalteromonas sp. MMG024]MCF6458158.1 hypothetical protein [Pseudoalteromonas sp. MMG024]